MENEIEMLKISDIDLASTLYTLGIPIDGIFNSDKPEYYGKPKMECYFKKTDATVKAVNDYYGNILRVNPRVLLANRKDIVTRVKHV